MMTERFCIDDFGVIRGGRSIFRDWHYHDVMDAGVEGYKYLEMLVYREVLWGKCPKAIMREIWEFVDSGVCTNCPVTREFRMLARRILSESDPPKRKPQPKRNWRRKRAVVPQPRPAGDFVPF